MCFNPDDAFDQLLVNVKLLSGLLSLPLLVQRPLTMVSARRWGWSFGGRDPGRKNEGCIAIFFVLGNVRKSQGNSDQFWPMFSISRLFVAILQFFVICSHSLRSYCNHFHAILAFSDILWGASQQISQKNIWNICRCKKAKITSQKKLIYFADAKRSHITYWPALIFFFNSNKWTALISKTTSSPKEKQREKVEKRCTNHWPTTQGRQKFSKS